MTKLGVVYTSTTPELITYLEAEIQKQLPGIEVVNFQNPSILAEAIESGHVNQIAATSLVTLYNQAILAGADIILNVCSSVGETADALQSYGDYVGVPIIRIDEAMCTTASRFQRVGVLATLPTTMQPTVNTIIRTGRKYNHFPKISQQLVENAFGADQEVFFLKLKAAAEKILADVDVIVLAQGSMAYAQEKLSAALQLPVLASPEFGVAAVKDSLQKQGLWEE